MSAEANSVASRAPWISSARFDLAMFFGASALGLLVLLLAFTRAVSPVALVWVYVALFDGPHMMAALTRTYFDRATRKDRAPLLWLAFTLPFAIPLGALALAATIANDAPFALFLAAMTIVSYWHIVRQGWGLFALYRVREGERATPRMVKRERAFFYGSMYAPYIYFLFTHPAVRDTIGAPHLALAWERVVAWVLAGASFAFMALFARAVLASRAKTAFAFGATQIGFFALMYFVFAAREPMYDAARGPDQAFMILTAATSVTHATQYIALVGLHNRRRYADATVHGAATHIGKSAVRFLGACLAFSTFYVVLARATHIYPLFLGDPSLPAPTFRVTSARVALALYWGIALQHYVLDARIWRIKTDPELRRVLFRDATTR